MTILPFLYSDQSVEEFLDDLLDTPDGWIRFVENHRSWGFDYQETAWMVRERSRGKYNVTLDTLMTMYETQRERCAADVTDQARAA